MQTQHLPPSPSSFTKTDCFEKDQRIHIIIYTHTCR